MTKFFLHSLLLLSVLALVSCKRDDGGEALRESFRTQEEYVLCEGEKVLLSFDRASYQYWCSPDKGLYRFSEIDGDDYMTLTLNGLPTESGKVSGSVSGTLGHDGLEFADLYILKKTTSAVWLWSDSSRCGIVLPSWGIIYR